MSPGSKLLTPQCRILPACRERLEGLQGFGEGRAATPVQEIEVDPIGLQPPEAALARPDRGGAAGIRREHLGDQEHLAAPARDRLTDQRLRGAVGIHLGGVDKGQAKIQAEAQRGDLVGALARVLSHHPTALAEDRDCFA
jgi:hypothetical protein